MKKTDKPTMEAPVKGDQPEAMRPGAKPRSSAGKQIADASYRAKVGFTEKKSRDYQKRPAGKNLAELRLIERAFRLIPAGSVLDAPCGGGRVSQLLAEKGYQMTAADFSGPMRTVAQENFRRAGLSIPVHEQDVERLSYPNRSFDAVVCFRLFHHFPDTVIRRRAVLELSRVARQFVALSYFTPHSVTSIQRRWRAARTGRPLRKHATSLEEVEGYFREAGFELVKNFAQLPLIHTLHLAVFRRIGS